VSRRPRQRTGDRTHVDGRRLSAQQWRALRQRWAARLPVPCPRCGKPINPYDSWDLDHVGIPHALATGDDDRVHPAHTTCNRRAGGELATAINEAGRAAMRGPHVNGDAVFLPTRISNWASARPGIPPREVDFDDADPTTPGPGDAVWDSCEWLRQFRDVPENATWPRLMSPPHPSAVGSYGAQVVVHSAGRGVELRYWQRLALARLLEHDADGRLVWFDAFVSTARQVGKSVLLRELGLWRIDAAPLLFGAEQTMMHTGKDLPSCREVQRPARVWAHDRAGDGWTTRDGNTDPQISAPNGSRWMIRGRHSVYSYTIALAVVDEAWGVDAPVVEDGLEPTLTEVENSQLVMFSTAHRRCTSLVPLRRGGLLANFGDEEPTSLILEWSAPRDADLEDRDAWRAASPHWTPRRERMLEAKLRRALSGTSADPDEDDPIESFRAQYLNVWPRRQWVARSDTEPLCDRDSWRHLTDIHAAPPDGPVVVAIDDYLGLRAAAAACAQLADGRFLVWGGEFDSAQDAYAWSAFTVGRRDACRVVVGRSLLVSDAEEWLPEATVERAASGATGTGLPLLRSLIRAGKIAHSGDKSLEDQVATVGLSPTIGGGLTQAHRGVRADLLHAVAWSVAAVAQPADEPLAFYVY